MFLTLRGEWCSTSVFVGSCGALDVKVDPALISNTRDLLIWKMEMRVKLLNITTAMMSKQFSTSFSDYLLYITCKTMFS